MGRGSVRFMVGHLKARLRDALAVVGFDATLPEEDCDDQAEPRTEQVTETRTALCRWALSSGTMSAFRHGRRRKRGMRVEPDTLSFGELLRHHRLAAQFTQEELAERAGISAR